MGLPFSRKNELKVTQYLESECTRLLSRIDAQSSDAQDEAIVASAAAVGAVASSGAASAESRRVQLAALRIQV